MEFSRDKSENNSRNETMALRLAYTALKIDTTKGVQDIFEKIAFNQNNQYYTIKIKGGAQYFNKDYSKILSSNDDGVYIHD